MNKLNYPFDGEWMRRKKKQIKRELLEKKEACFITKKIAILGGSTTDELRDMLELFLLDFGIKPMFYSSEYNRFYEDAVFENPALAEFNPDIIYIHTSLRNISCKILVTDTDEMAVDKISDTYSHFLTLWENLKRRYNAVIIQNNFEYPFYRYFGNQDCVYPQGMVRFVNEMNMLFVKYARENSDFFIHDINYESAQYGLDEWSDPKYWYMYKYAMCIPAIPMSARNVALIIKSVYGMNKKALSLDLDNTLWGGVIGEDGADNIEIGHETATSEAYTEFQSYLKGLKDMGVLLSVNSKNDESVAEAGFDRPDSVLKREDFAAFKANWESKDRNLQAVSDELRLLPESFVFADDNPAEREMVRQSFEAVAVPELSEAEGYIKLLDHGGYFEVTGLSEDDLKRAKMYEQNAKRDHAKASYADYGDYLKSLDMRAQIKPFSAVYMKRIAELTNKSNQFNLTTLRLTQSELEKLAADRNYITLYGKLEDKFGDNGVVSVVIAKKEEEALHIRLWLMSCRVLKRDMEYAMMDELLAICKKEGIGKVYGYYIPTAKNAMVRDFYTEQGFDTVKTEQDETVYVLETGKYRENQNRYITVNGREEN